MFNILAIDWEKISMTFGALFFLIKFIITVVFFIPSMLVYVAVSLIIPPIISFITMCNVALREGNYRAVIYNIVIHIFLILTWFAMESNPGTDDTLANLDKVVDSAVYGSIFTFCALIFFVLYLTAVGNSSYKRRQKEKEKNTIKIVKDCPNCGTVNDAANNYCSQCGTKM